MNWIKIEDEIEVDEFKSLGYTTHPIRVLILDNINIDKSKFIIVFAFFTFILLIYSNLKDFKRKAFVVKIYIVCSKNLHSL
jgi:hypothetical protein